MYTFLFILYKLYSTILKILAIQTWYIMWYIPKNILYQKTIPKNIKNSTFLLNFKNKLLYYVS